MTVSELIWGLVMMLLFSAGLWFMFWIDGRGRR